MTSSRARLAVKASEGRTSIVEAAAEAPQRWSFGRPGSDGWTEVVHQLLGDGIFERDRVRTTIHAGTRVRLAVRGLTAVPLRPGNPSVAATRVDVAAEATMLWLPGALVPHAGAVHTAGVAIHAAPGARVFAATVLTPGRSAMGEWGAFTRLGLHTRVYVAGEPVLSEQTVIDPAELPGPGSVGGHGVVASLVCVGPWPPAERGWWAELPVPGAVVAAGRLRREGLAVRGLFPTLGAASAFLEGAERRARASVAPSGIASFVA